MMASHIDQEERRYKVTKKEWSKERTKIKYTEIGTVLFKQPSGKEEIREEKERRWESVRKETCQITTCKKVKIWQVLW